MIEMKREKLIEITDKIYFYCLKIKEEYQATDEEMSEAIAEVLDFFKPSLFVFDRKTS